MFRSVLKLAVIGLLLCALLGAAYYAYRVLTQSVEGWSHYVPAAGEEGPAEVALKDSFLSGSVGVEARYEALFGYFAAAAVDYASASGARIHYPGAGSSNGYSVSGLEGFARTGPLLAAWIASGRGEVVADGRAIDLVGFLRRGILAGTDPASEEYWGPIKARNLRILEAADIARILWMTRKQIWNGLDEDGKRRIADWLSQASLAETADNNWLLAPVTVTLAMKALGLTPQADETQSYERFKRHYLGNGWFFDDPGVVGYYNAWGMTYELFWITTLDEQLDRAFIRQAIEDSAGLMAHLIAPQGYPVMGRSICYRTAVPAPLIAQALIEPDPQQAGLARRAMEAVWRYFVARGSLLDGTLTQGYFGSDLRLLDIYSGPGSCHWGLRSLVLAFLNPKGSDFWLVPEVPLPVEVADYRLELDALGWIIEGDKETGEITIEIPENTDSDIPIKDYDWRHRLYETVFQKPRRPYNHPAQYKERVYSSAKPFWAD